MSGGKILSLVGRFITESATHDWCDASPPAENCCLVGTHLRLRWSEWLWSHTNTVCPRTVFHISVLTASSPPWLDESEKIRSGCGKMAAKNVFLIVADILLTDAAWCRPSVLEMLLFITHFVDTSKPVSYTHLTLPTKRIV